ncbi:MAG: transposase, partial [Magnetococcales bacterium]|nr:transposase [Magnetococcales bacterium]
MFDVHSTSFARTFPVRFFQNLSGPGARLLVYQDASGGHCAMLIRHDLESPALPANLVWFGCDPATILHLHGVAQTSWQRLWLILWQMIPSPLTNGRLVLALDDFINPKTGKKVFGCATFFDHAAKANQSQYPWAQNVVCLGLLKQIKERWACLPLASRFYLPKTSIDQKTINATKGKQTVPFQNKLDQAVAMLVEVANSFTNATILVVCDNWFGNDGLLNPARKELGSRFHMLSRLRSNTVVHAQPEPKTKPQRGRPSKYGIRLGSISELAARYRDEAQEYSVQIYGKQRTILAYSSVAM